LTLSVIVITKNEATNIAACLASVAFAQEWIVVDSGSTDDTVALARTAGATVIERPDWAGFGIQKNRALAAASGEWVLSIDADERVSTALQAEILAGIARPDIDGFEIARLTRFHGRCVRNTAWSPNTPSIRLFRRSRGRFREVLVHENVELASARRRHLKTPLDHFSFEDPEAQLRKMNQYSSLAAEILFSRGRRANLASALIHTLAAFFKAYVIKAGFLDGKVGLMIAIMVAETTYHKYLKLMLLTDAATGR
jgi:glycosyltransferase involved in cell wall biosynthesis